MAFANTQNIDPALRQNSLSSPPKPRETTYQNGAQAPSYSPLQPMAPSPNNSYAPAAGMPPSTPSYYPANQSTQQNHESPAEDSPPANPNDPNDLKRPRACEACRQLKVKCEPDDSSPTGSCKRCAKANRQCLVTAPSRKRQKKTDSRVAELEKKIDALTATLAAKGGADPDLEHSVPHHLPPPHTLPQHPPPTYGAQWSGGPPPPPPPPTVHVSPQQNLNQQQQQQQQQHHGVKRKMSGYDYFGGELQRSTATTTGPGAGYRPPMPQPPHFGGAIPSPIPRIRTEEEDTIYDPITHAAMDTRTVKKCWDRYNHDMCHHLPIVVFPEGLKWEDLRKTKPILFLAIVAVSSGTIRPDLQGKLLTEVTKILADRIVYRGEKSLELIQTIQTMTTFYQPPEKYEELNFNQLIHIAAVMALDIGLGKRFKKGNVALWRSYTEQKRALPDPNSAETRRCWLGCYYMCSNSSMSLRRPLLIRWSPYAEECIDILSTAQDAAPTDKWLCVIARGQHIAEDIGLEFSMDDPASQVSLTDHKTQYHLKAFEKQLLEWLDSATLEMQKQPILQHMYGVINLYMHEISMHHNHNIDDFRPPFHATPIDGPPDPDFVTPAHIESLTTCMNSVHTVFDAFLSMDKNLLRALPTLFFVRNSYAAVALIKMYTAVSAKDSKFGSIIKTDDLRVDYYLERMIAALTQTAEGGMCRVAQKFSLIFNMLKQWHVRRTDPDYREGSNPISRQRTPLGGPVFPGRAGQGERKGSGVSALMQQDNSNMGWQHPNQQPGPGQRNGLQMLSEAAMGPNQPAGPPGPGQVLAPPTHQWVPPGGGPGQQQQQMAGLAPMNQDMDPGLMYAGMPGQELGMEPMDLMAYGFGDEFMAMGFGMGIEQGGWAF